MCPRRDSKTIASSSPPARRQANWWERLFGREPKQNAFAELCDRLEQAGPAAFTPELLAEKRRAFHLSETELREGLENLYAFRVRQAVKDGIVTDEEQAVLDRLLQVGGIPPAVARSILRDLAGGGYARALAEATADESFTPEERKRLDDLAAKLRLPADLVDEIRKEELTKVMQAAVDRSIADRRLSPEEDEHLRRLASDLGVTVSNDSTSTTVLNRFRILWRIENGELPTVSAPVHLQRGENCHATLPCSLFETRVVTRAIGYSGPRARIRIAKGLYWNVGAVALAPDRREEWKELDRGSLYVTSKRLIFDGGTKSSNLPWRRVLNFQIYSDGLKIEKDSGRDQLFKGTPADPEVFAAIVEAARRRAEI